MADKQHSHCHSSLLVNHELGTVVEQDELDNSSNIETKICLVGEKCLNNRELLAAAKTFDFEVLQSETGEEYINDLEHDIIFVLDEFEGVVYERLFKKESRIIGPNVIFQCADKKEKLPYNARPLLCMAMTGLVICCTGFKTREVLSKLVLQVHHMGGGIRKDFSTKVTHLVANSTTGDKYRAAVSLGTPIMSEEWIHKTWENRNQIGIHATDENMMHHRVPPFFTCVVSFLGFSQDEQTHMVEILKASGGRCVEPGDSAATHLVVEDGTIKEIPFDTPQKLQVVRAEWFWASIQMDACAAEELYLFEPTRLLETLEGAKMTPSTPCGGGLRRQRKRKRLKENLAQLADDGRLSPTKPVPPKRRSSDYNVRLSMSAGSLSFLDATPDQNDEKQTPKSVTSASIPMSPPLMTKRHHIAMELLETENNYVEILHTIVKVFREPLEAAEQVGGPLLSPTEIKIIFGKLQPIYEVHEKLKTDLADRMSSWDERNSIGDIILKHAESFLTAYPPFVNFFEKTKEELLKCDKTKPRFHAFLKICQNKPECGRQSLVELMIRPVQRLPSVVLLLTDLLKHTSKDNPDQIALEKAIASLKEVMTHINEDKRKTEGQVVMFDIVNDIDNCPPDLLSSHRQFITKADMIELNDGLGHKGDNLTMFLFNDSLEICKRRMKVINSLRSPRAGSVKTPQKCYKHLELIHLLHIRRVVDILETEGCQNVFALVTKSPSDAKEQLLVFALIENDKTALLRTICRHMANTGCRTDSENFLISLEPHQLDIESSDVGNTTLSKAVRFASKVSRAFSFNKTPRKLKRAMSSMATGFSPWGSAGDPSSSGVQISKLASCADLNSPARKTPTGKAVTLTPKSAGIKTKFKSSSLGHQAAKHL